MSNLATWLTTWQATEFAWEVFDHTAAINKYGFVLFSIQNIFLCLMGLFPARPILENKLELTRKKVGLYHKVVSRSDMLIYTITQDIGAVVELAV